MSIDLHENDTDLSTLTIHSLLYKRTFSTFVMGFERCSKPLELLSSLFKKRKPSATKSNEDKHYNRWEIIRNRSTAEFTMVLDLILVIL
jgi:hypothetical protein